MVLNMAKRISQAVADKPILDALERSLLEDQPGGTSGAEQDE